MFESAVLKLEEARVILDQLQTATDSALFRSQFNSFLSAARAVTNALQKEGADVDGFADWYAAKQAEMRADGLMRFIHEARIEDFHQGKHRLTFSTYVAHMNTKDAGPPPAPGASLVIGADGVFWVVDSGTPNERRIPATGGTVTVAIGIDNPPETHLGQRIETNPIEICTLALTYLDSLVHEANTRFGGEAPPGL